MMMMVLVSKQHQVTTKYKMQAIPIPVKSHGFAVNLTVLAMKSRSHADYVISHAFQLSKFTK